MRRTGLYLIAAAHYRPGANFPRPALGAAGGPQGSLRAAAEQGAHRLGGGEGVHAGTPGGTGEKSRPRLPGFRGSRTSS